MRYQNWDVLLFPANSRIPTQEFDTKCHVVADKRRFPPVATSTTDTDPFLANFESMTKLPILTCFVSSLSQGQAFRVSIHSWTKPRGSSLLESYRAINESVSFQARVYIDGVLQSYRSFDQDTIWPEVIETSAIHRFTDDNEPLRFPPFHQEILEQSHWEANEQFGRVRVVIAEGVTQETTLGEPPKFLTLRDVVAFSFQHAPKSILEHSGIAWPNRRMFESIRSTPVSRRLPCVRGHEVHSHSPQRSSKPSVEDLSSYSGGNVPQTQTQYPFRAVPDMSRSHATMENNITAPIHTFNEVDDPFIMPPPLPPHQWRLQLRSSSHDVSMPDYISQKTASSRANTDMSGISYPKRDFERQVNEAAVDEIIQALSPTKKEQLANALSPPKSPHSGLNAPTNTPMTEQADSHQVSPEAQVVSKAKTGDSVPRPDLNLSNSKLRHSTRASPSKSRAASTQSNENSTTAASEQDHAVRKLSLAFNGWRETTSVNLAKAMVDAEQAEVRRQRSESGSSKRKRSLSPLTNEQTIQACDRNSPGSESSEDRDPAAGELDREGVSLQVLE